MTFKVGDKVEIIANTTYSCNWIGEVGYVLETESYKDGSGMCRVAVMPNRGEFGNWSYFSELKLITGED